MTTEAKQPDNECRCGYIKLNGKRTNSRNLSPNCPIHAEEERKAAERLGFHW